MIGFIIWAVVGCFFIGIGISSFSAEKTTGFWANVKMFEVDNVREYNNAMGKLWCIFGIVFILLGLPMLDEDNTPLILLSIIGVMIEVITIVIIYTQIIEKKYRKQ